MAQRDKSGTRESGRGGVPDATRREEVARPKRVRQAGESGAHPAYGKPVAERRPFPPEKPEEDYGARGLHRRAGTTKPRDGKR